MTRRGLEHLFERFRSHGDVAALGQVFDATAPSLRQVARHLTRDRAEAEDLVQATFLAAIEKRATFDATRELSPWLTGILLKQASLARRARGRVVEPDRLETRDSEDPHDVAAARELSEALTVALARLSPADRDVLIPLLLDGRRAVEIARELGRRPDTVHMRIHRGLTRLRRLLPASFAVAALMRSSQARGLGAVRAEVLRHARLEVSGPAAVSVGATAAGIAMTMKQIAAVLALASVLGLGGYLVAARTAGESELRGAPIVRSELAADVEGIEAPRDAAAARAPASELLETPPVSASTGAALVIEVVREGGEPAANALLALADAEGHLTSSRTDADGRSVLDAGTGAGRLYVRDEACFPYQVALDLGAGRRTVELPRGEELSGRVMLKGEARLPRIELTLSTDSVSTAWAEADVAVFQALELMTYGQPKLVVRTTPAADGTFRFRGLEPHWSGSIELPHELVFVEDSKLTRSSTRVCPRAVTGLDLTIAYGARVIGRLVDATTREPLATTPFQVALLEAGGNSMIMGARTDGEGRFTLPVGESLNLARIEISWVFGPAGRMAHPESVPTWDRPCEPCDAGDVEWLFPATRPIVFRAVDARSIPLPDATAQVDELQPVTVDEHGVGTLATVPLAAQSLRVVAPGYAIATVPLSPETASPIDVVLAATNRLTITLPSVVAGRNDLFVDLMSRPFLFGGDSRMYDWRLREKGMVGLCTATWGSDPTQEGRVRFGFSKDGRVEVEGIQTDIPFVLRLIGAGGRNGREEALAEIAIEALGPEEHRRVDLELPLDALRSLHVLRGRVIDENGRPIQGAGVATLFAANMILVQTNLDGTFRLDLSGSDTSVEVTKRGYVPFRVRKWNLASGRDLEATLRRGHDLRVELVDENGHALHGAKVQTWMAGFGHARGTETGDAGVFTVDDLPLERTSITIDVGGKRYERWHESGDVARIVLPRHGRLEVTWRYEGPRDNSKSYHLALRPVGAEGAAQVEGVFWSDRVLEHVFESVLPGEYTIGLEVDANASDDVEAYAPLREPARVTIAGGATARVEL